jgi:hypothetical protein
MKAITPPKLIPPDQSTAASGALPIEQTKLSTAMTGPAITFSIVRRAAGASVMKRALKKSSPSRPMKPASRKPIVISFQSIFQSPRKLCATSDQASTDVTFSFQVPLASADGCRWRTCAVWACSRACSSSPGETKVRSRIAISAISRNPPTNSASVNCQPIRIQITRPSSQTRLVEANWKASEVAAEAPFWKSDFAIAIAA